MSWVVEVPCSSGVCPLLPDPELRPSLPAISASSWGGRETERWKIGM
jgi:hypothetical protein